MSKLNGSSWNAVLFIFQSRLQTLHTNNLFENRNIVKRFLWKKNFYTYVLACPTSLTSILRVHPFVKLKDSLRCFELNVSTCSHERHETIRWLGQYFSHDYEGERWGGQTSIRWIIACLHTVYLFVTDCVQLALRSNYTKNKQTR